jgi:molecular chaperone GrpE
MAENRGPSAADVDAQPTPPAQASAAARDGVGGASAPPGQAAAESASEVATEDRANRVAELEAALAAARAEAAEHWEKYLRERAEMENYKKRVERTYADLARRGRKDLLAKVAGAVDNLERAISYETAQGREVDAANLLTGLRMTYQQFADLLAGEGLKEIKSVGEQFDPALHEAVATESATDKPDGEIVAEVQKGYTYGEELLRPARVKVAKRE